MNQREHQLIAIERSHDQPFVSRSREVIHRVLVAVFLTAQRIMMMHNSQERRASFDVSGAGEGGPRTTAYRIHCILTWSLATTATILTYLGCPRTTTRHSSVTASSVDQVAQCFQSSQCHANAMSTQPGDEKQPGRSTVIYKQSLLSSASLHIGTGDTQLRTPYLSVPWISPL